MKKALLSLATIAILASCGGSSNEASNEETTVQAEETTTDAAISGEYNVDTQSSMLHWEGDKIVGDGHHGIVNYKSGSVKVQDGKVVGGEVVVDMTTITEKDAGSEEYAAKLVGHLMSEDFFKVDSFPTSKIVVKSVENGIVNADLTIKDVTKAISFPAEISVSEDAVNVNAKFNINRTDWGVVYGSGNFFDLAKDKTIKDEIGFEVMLTAKK
jgi:polyisoprenoid-binding protein YceI